MERQTNMMRALVRPLLEKPFAHEWSLQGFGMLRCYLTTTTRLHLWHNKFAIKGVSLIHDHPWDFTSFVIAGMLRNVRYVEVPWGKTHMRQMILCGPGGCLKDSPEVIGLALNERPEVYKPGDVYRQFRQEVHSSHYLDGTVTVCDRWLAPHDDPSHAHVFWPHGEQWVSAEPRPATRAEIEEITQAALVRLNEGN